MIVDADRAQKLACFLQCALCGLDGIGDFVFYVLLGGIRKTAPLGFIYILT